MDRNFNYQSNESGPKSNYSTNRSIKTRYYFRKSDSEKDIKNNEKEINQNDKMEINNRYNLPDTNRVFNPNLQEEPKYFKIKNIKSHRMNDNWNSMISRTSNEESICGSNQRISKSKTYQSKIFPNENEKFEPKRISKESQFSNHLTQTQIVNLPGGIKRGVYDIKDDKFFDNKRNIGHIYKLNKDFNADIILKENLKDSYNNDVYPNQKVINQNPYPVQQRFRGSYKKNNESGIFDMNRKEDYIKPGKRMFHNLPFMKSQFEIA